MMALNRACHYPPPSSGFVDFSISPFSHVRPAFPPNLACQVRMQPPPEPLPGLPSGRPPPGCYPPDLPCPPQTSKKPGGIFPEVALPVSHPLQTPCNIHGVQQGCHNRAMVGSERGMCGSSGMRSHGGPGMHSRGGPGMRSRGGPGMRSRGGPGMRGSSGMHSRGGPGMRSRGGPGMRSRGRPGMPGSSEMHGRSGRGMRGSPGIRRGNFQGRLMFHGPFHEHGMGGGHQNFHPQNPRFHQANNFYRRQPGKVWPNGVLQEKNKFSCDVCDKGFPTQETYNFHISTHVRCNIDGCNFEAAPKLVQNHIKYLEKYGLPHLGVMNSEAVQKWKNSDAFPKWKAERMKRYPTSENIEKAAKLGKVPVEPQRSKKVERNLRGRGRYRARGRVQTHRGNSFRKNRGSAKQRPTTQLDSCADPLSLILKSRKCSPRSSSFATHEELLEAEHSLGALASLADYDCPSEEESSSNSEFECESDKSDSENDFLPDLEMDDMGEDIAQENCQARDLYHQWAEEGKQDTGE